MSYTKQKKGSTVKHTTKKKSPKFKELSDEEVYKFFHPEMKGLGDLGKS